MYYIINVKIEGQEGKPVPVQATFSPRTERDHTNDDYHFSQEQLHLGQAGHHLRGRLRLQCLPTAEGVGGRNHLRIIHLTQIYIESQHNQMVGVMIAYDLYDYLHEIRHYSKVPASLAKLKKHSS